jgi:tetratricopeptide (TPR) repeat protein
MPLKKRIFTIVAGLAFLGFMGSQVQTMILQGMRETQQRQEMYQTNTNEEALEELQAQENGYQTVLEREPNNQNALAGLVQIRLDMQDYQGAIKPLKQLVELNPNQKNYQQLLKKLQQKAVQH